MNKVGISAKKARIPKNIRESYVKPTFFILARVMPVFMWIMFAGIRPKNVAMKNTLKGTPRIGLDRFIIRLGTIGVILKNNK